MPDIACGRGSAVHRYARERSRMLARRRIQKSCLVAPQSCAGVFRHSFSHSSRSASLQTFVSITSMRFHFMNRYAISHSTAIAARTIASVQSPFLNSVSARPRIIIPTTLPRGWTSQIREWHLGHSASLGKSVPLTCTVKASPQPQVMGNENFTFALWLGEFRRGLPLLQEHP